MKKYSCNDNSRDLIATIRITGKRTFRRIHYCDAKMGIVASQITSLRIVYTTVYSDADQSKHQSCASLAFVWGIHRGPVNSPHKWSVTRKMFPFDDVIIMSEDSSVKWAHNWNDARKPYYYDGLTLIPTWISHNIHCSRWSLGMDR